MAFLRAMPACEKRAIVFTTPFETCLERNRQRSRVVPENVMFKMLKNFQPPHYAEGFSSINYINYGESTNLEVLLQKAFTVPHDNPHHTWSCGKHCAETLLGMIQYIEKHNSYSFRDINILYHAAGYHDIGKPICKVFMNAKGQPTGIAHFYGHENASAYIYLSGMSWIKDNEEDATEIANLIALHMEFFNGERRLEKIKKLYGEDFYNKLALLHEMDVKAHSRRDYED